MISNLSNSTPLTAQTERGVSIYYEGKYLYSKYAPIPTVERVVRNLSFTPQTLYFIPSPLLCYGLTSIINKIDSHSALLLWEPLEPLHQLTDTSFQSWILESALAKELQDERRIFFCHSKKLNELLEIGQSLIEEHQLRRITPLLLSAGNALYLKEYETALQELTGILSEFWKNRSTKSFLSFKWYQNIFLNLAQYEPHLSFTSIATKISKQPKKEIAVLGAGPTLNQFLPKILANRGHWLLFAADTALPALLTASIIPDFLVVLEAQQTNFKSFHSVRPYVNDITLCCDLVVDPKVARLFPKKVWLSAPFSKQGLLPRLTPILSDLCLIPELGSVGIVALFLALCLAEKIGTSAINAAGLDFSAPRGQSHANGSSYHQLKLAQHHRLNPIENSYSISQNEECLSIQEEGHSPINFFTQPVLKNYLHSSIELANLSFIKIDGSAFFLKYLPSEATNSPQKGLLSLIHEINHPNSLKGHRETIQSFLQQEIKLLNEMLHSSDGIEAFIEKEAPLAYLTETFVISSKEKGDNHLAGKIKLNGYRLLQKANQSSSLLRTDKKAL